MSSARIAGRRNDPALTLKADWQGGVPDLDARGLRRQTGSAAI